MSKLVLWFREISADHVAKVGGKNASLGEMYRELSPKGIRIPNGFATTAEAYWLHLESGKLKDNIATILSGLNTSNVQDLSRRGKQIRDLIVGVDFDPAFIDAIISAYRELCKEYGENADVAVRSSATAEDLPSASFAGQQETFLNISGERAVLDACRRCFASLFTDRAISYRVDKGFDHLSVALSVGVQKMVRSDLACSGVNFTIDTETGFSNVVLISGIYGLGEPLVQGQVNPDEFCVFKPTLRAGFKPIISKTLGAKQTKMIYGGDHRDPTKTVRVPVIEQRAFVLNDEEVLTLARWSCEIEDHYTKRALKPTPMDIEWAKDGHDGKLYIVQARPETVVSQRNANVLRSYRLKEKGSVLCSGRAVGQMIGQGVARVIVDPSGMKNFCDGEVLVTENTDPDWEPLMKKAHAVVTNRGGRTSHAAIVSRELGIPCIVGATDATEKIQSGKKITVSCAEGDCGRVYDGLLAFESKEVLLNEVPQVSTKIALNVGEPENAFALSFLPNDGVGLARLEFIINSYIGIHPRALLEFEKVEDKAVRREIEKRTHGYDDKGAYFVEQLAHGVATIVAAFHPKPVIVRMSDFKSNEYAHLLGGEHFEPAEENPMIGWRGASRYYSEQYKASFGLECAAMKRVYREFGLKNLVLMIPFCRTVDEARKVIRVMKEYGIEQSEIPVYGMCEIPANVLLAEEFLEIFDGFSIGTNDLTQLTLGLDRDSALVSEIFDERNEAVKKLVREVVRVARAKGKYIGICGDAPSTYPEFAEFLLDCGISAISLSPDVALSTRLTLAKYETGRSAIHQ